MSFWDDNTFDPAEHAPFFGVFQHFLYGDPGDGREETLPDYDWDARVRALDVDYIARTAAGLGARYYFITLMQGKKYMIAPNAAFDRVAGTKPGEACATRDLVADLYEALHPYGIDLCLYFTGDGPYQDPVAGERFGFVEPRQNVSDGFVAKWAAVLEEYAVRYGDRVAAWWMDGTFDKLGYDSRNLRPYADAIRCGNPKAAMAFNNGVSGRLAKWYPGETFTAGEQNDLTLVPDSAFVDGARAHILAPIGLAEKPWARWCKPGCAYTHAEIEDYIRRVNAAGGAVTLDMRIGRDGAFDADQLCAVRMK